MNTNFKTPTFASNYAVIIKKDKIHKAAQFNDDSDKFIEKCNKKSHHKAELTVVNLKNRPESKMFVFSMPNIQNEAFENFAKESNVNAVNLDRLA